jgi:hypothetical protein
MILLNKVVLVSLTWSHFLDIPNVDFGSDLVSWKKVRLFNLSQNGSETAKSYLLHLIPIEPLFEGTFEFERIIERIWGTPS